MDTLTHALSGALIAHATGTPRNTANEPCLKLRTWAGFIAGAFPDVDYLLSFIDPMLYLNAHRGVTHSLLMLPLWALLLAWLFSRIFRSQGLNWKSWFGVCVMALGIHIAGDTITSYGTQLFAPFTTWKAALNTTFIIDLWFSGIIILSLLIAVWRRAPRVSQLGLSVLTLYICGQAVAELSALDYARQYIRDTGLDGYHAEAFPQPASPLRWKLIVSNGEDHHIAHVDFRKSTPPADEESYFARLARGYDDPESLKWSSRTLYPQNRESSLARTVWQADDFAGFREFAGYPAYAQSKVSADQRCVWFTDLRFGAPGSTPPFRFGLCQQAGSSEWTLNRLPRRFSKDDRSRTDG